MDPPKIPPRPTHRNIERSRSPNSENYPRSPLNEPPAFMQHSNLSGSLYSNEHQNTSSSSLGLPKRPPSVSLPSIGQEGAEYADLDYEKEKPEEATILDQIKGKSQPEQTRNVGSDLPLHAPRPSFSSSTAKERVAAVTRTDSSSAMAAGIGKAVTPIGSDDKDPHKRSLHPKVSFSSRPDSVASTERPGSAQEGSDHGIPDVGIGQRVPMYPDAGDVQAPSPSPYSQNLPSGIGFHNDGSSRSRNQGRKSSAQLFHGPPGSYGMHGHGSIPADNFEKAWYDKHPEALEREEHGQYGPAIGTRPEWALSSEDLNKLVRDTASRGAGFGTSPNVVGLPNEQIGYMATEEYTSRMNTPYSATLYSKTFSNHSQTHISSPLRKASFPVDGEGNDGFRSSKRKGGSQSSAEHALESETDDEAIHVDAPTVRKSKIGGNGYDPPTEDLGPHGGNTEAQGGYIDETGYGVPILASDEVAKEPGTEYMQPAVSPAQERRGSTYYSGMDSDAPPSYQSGLRHGSRPGSATNSRPTSRPGSRPGSIHGLLPGLTRFTSHDDREDLHTPLEDVEEYEPLFPDDDGKDTQSNPGIERFKRREMMKRRFPSQDIWEDTPNSLQLQATVSTPEAVEETAASAFEKPSATFESPEAEGARKGETTEAEKAKLIPKEERLAKSTFKPHIRGEMHRPGMIQRFPSRDIWEDSPDSARLETTVDGPQDRDVTSPVDDGLKAGAVVHTSGRPGEGNLVGKQGREGATAGSAAVEKPTIPPRPTKHKAENADVVPQPPVQIPARPPRRLHQVPPAEIPPPPTKSAEASPTETKKAPTLPDRPKPQVPARPIKPVARDSSESIPLSKTTSATSTGSSGPREEVRGLTSPPPGPKPKPALPARPIGGKIAALKAGFMSDLNKQLQVGPQGPKKEEKPVEEEEREVEEKTPLADARKGRARGPARRKPVANSTSATSEQGESKVEMSKWAIRAPQTIWESENGSIIITSSKAATPRPLTDRVSSPIERPEAPTPITAATAHTDIRGNVPAVEALEEALPSTEEISAKEGLSSNPEPSAVKEAEISDLLQHDSQAPRTTLGELDALTSKAPATAAPADMASESIQTGTTEMADNQGQEKEEKLTAYLGGEAQKGEDVIVKE
ncbi:MAG: hypothetical protein L6R38_006660 [Xanthoria sp. 2 TBL-2021]|nr:MAG: hypothetical protein L6R38_006660 [Xanthoria sp. 2 TBL-2021]